MNPMFNHEQDKYPQSLETIERVRQIEKLVLVFEGGVIFDQGRDDLSYPGYTHHDEQLHVYDESGFLIIIIKNNY